MKKRFNQWSTAWIACIVILLCSSNSWSQLPPHPERGVVAQFGAGELIPDNLPDAVDNIEVSFEWGDLEKEEDLYEFSAIGGELEKIVGMGKKAFIQISTRSHPGYIFQRVPYLMMEEWGGKHGSTKGYGVPMLWHPDYKERYASLLYNLGLYLRRSEFGEHVLGIIPDVKFILGSQLVSFAESAKDSLLWSIPEGSDMEGVDWWMEGTWSGYLEYMHEVHRRAGSGMGWMYLYNDITHPGNIYKLKMAEIFADQCKSGLAFGYSWTGDMPSKAELTESQFIHWNILYHLQAGASFLSIPGKYLQDTSRREDLAFFSKYAGLAARPDTLPGIWAAFRKGRQMPGDLTIGMERNEALPSDALNHTDSTKFGLWGRKLEPMTTLQLKMDQYFLENLHPKLKISIRVWYLDDDHSVFRIHAFNGIHPIQKTGSGRWKMAEIRRRPLIKNQTLDLVALDGPLTVHMIEIAKYGY